MIKTVIFDLGGVLVDWNPRYLYDQLIETEEERNHFLQRVATQEWNAQQDAGRTLKDATDWLVERHPEYEIWIRAYYGRWEEMIAGAIGGTVEILQQLHQMKKHRLYALTNWSRETFPVARKMFPWLNYFEGIVVSGEEKLIKPDPRIYYLLLDRYQIEAGSAVFIDDNRDNVESARQVGLHAIHFQAPEQLREALHQLEVL